jgi:hypothetical protein
LGGFLVVFSAHPKPRIHSACEEAVLKTWTGTLLRATTPTHSKLKVLKSTTEKPQNTHSSQQPLEFPKLIIF